MEYFGAAIADTGNVVEGQRPGVTDMSMKPGEVVDGKYEIQGIIGKGGMSCVYLATDLRLGKNWAIKEIRRTADGKEDDIRYNSLLAEADLLKKLDHPALPRIVDIIDSNEYICVVMDYVEGKSLDKVIRQAGHLPQEKVVEWTGQLCSALGYLHRQRPPVIYRDMKPANVMLTPAGRVKLIDFGIAREYRENGLADTAFLGTRGYAPPEQHGAGQTDARSDIYALGMTMHHMLTGADPRSAGYEYAPIRRFDSSLSRDLERIVEKCTAMDPRNRYQSCRELLYDLDHMGETGHRKKRRKRRQVIFCTVIILAAVSVTAGEGYRRAGIFGAEAAYEEKLDIADSYPYEEKEESYMEAADMAEGDVRPYLKLLELYRENGLFGDEESSRFMEKFNSAVSLFDRDSDDYLELLYQTGITYFYLYTGGDGSFRSRILKASPFFQEIAESGRTDFEHYDVSERYWVIGDFYRRYVVDANGINEPDYEDYRELVDSLKDCVGYMEDYEDGDAAYIRLTMYRETADLLNSYRMGLADAGVGEDEVLGLLDLVCEKTGSLIVTRERSLDIQKDVEEKWDVYASNIKRAYINTGERD